jgi:uncharacterized protein YcfJ
MPLLFVNIIVAPESRVLKVFVTLPEIEALGNKVGDKVGGFVGDLVGGGVGAGVGFFVGCVVGPRVGARLGFALGEAVGSVLTKLTSFLSPGARVTLTLLGVTSI